MSSLDVSRSSFALILLGLQIGLFAPALDLSGAWIFLQYSHYEFGADKSACERVGSDAMVKMLELSRERLRPWILRWHIHRDVAASA